MPPTADPAPVSETANDPAPADAPAPTEASADLAPVEAAPSPVSLIPDGTSLEDAVGILERAVRTLATTLYAPNGGGDENVAEAKALYAAVCGDPPTV